MVTAGVVALALACGTDAPPVSEKAARRAAQRPPFDGWVRRSQYVAVRDGTRLALDLFHPTRGGNVAVEPLPVVWTQTPYRRAVMDEGRPYTVIDLYPWLDEVLRHGYVVACADVRGTGASFGRFEGMFSPAETRDGYDLTEWLATREWSSGKVGMYGQSYLGITQYLVAGAEPPHLAAIFPEMALTDVYDFVYKGGIDHLGIIESWCARLRKRDGEEAIAVPVDADGDRSLLRAAIAEHAAGRDPAAIYAALPFRDGVDAATGDRPYRSGSPMSYLSQIRRSRVAVYHLAGWYDRYVRDQLVLFRNLGPRQRLAIGPWTHSQTTDDFDYAGEHLRFWDRWLKGSGSEAPDESPVRYYVMGTPPGNAWRSASAWPLPDERRVAYWLGGGRSGTAASANDGDLAPTRGTAGSDELVVDPTASVDPNPRWTTEPAAPDLAANDAKGLTYTTATLAAALEVTGHPVAHLWVSASAPDVDLFVYLEEVDADGGSRYVSEGALRASHRATADPGYDFLGLPFHRGNARDRVPLPAGEPVELAIELYPTSTLFAAGHRLRLTITGADRANARTPETTPPPRLTVHRRRDRASWLDLPVIPARAP